MVSSPMPCEFRKWIHDSGFQSGRDRQDGLDLGGIDHAFPCWRNYEHALLSDDPVGRHTRFKCFEGVSF